MSQVLADLNDEKEMLEMRNQRMEQKSVIFKSQLKTVLEYLSIEFLKHKREVVASVQKKQAELTHFLKTELSKLQLISLKMRD